uniref:Uncharacterized protein n=1 Tax=Chromera velia CCMP2878 TaxID=1169474 RepID=A0A0G4IAH6_9ALVE|eukprot:Cvel_12548.t1-p1 / transcript=Cvel_12548.t1 / gene=Cvel_12548 / organism=Chromera_velia_CCMP2878 / gene_product=hypothetical protein / transcript_product=hypothetical protein / location=Cvel_scaffold824:57604-62663(+) / protein_length=1122 / sequence_SO=supercontig / SO=protein_coding / is_pseudo=false
MENEETAETDLVEVEEETVIVGGHCGVDKHVTAVRNRRAREASGQKEKRQQDIRETFKATKKPKPSVSSSSASSGVSASAATADADATPPPQPIPCLGLQWLSAKNPSFFSLEEQGEHFNLVFEYRKAEHLGGVYRETTTEGVLKGVTVLRAKGCTREGTMRSSIPTERVGEDRIEKAGLVPWLSFEWTSCDKCYNACAKTFKSSVFGDKKEFLDKVMNVIRLCDKGAYTYERDLHIVEQKLQSEQTSAAEMRELFRQQSEKRQLHEKEKNLMKEKGWFSANSGPNGNAAKYYDYKSWQTLEKRVEIFRKGIVGAEDRRRLHFIDNDDFLKKFLPLYRSGQLDGTPFLDLSRALVNRHLGWKNAPLGEQGYKKWIGGCWPKQSLSPEDYDVAQNPLPKEELAEYVTTALLVLHDVKLTTIVLGAILHKEGLLNDHGTFRDAVIQVAEGNDKIKLLNVCFDGDTIQAPWVVEKLVAYLKGEIFWTASSCTPHTGKCSQRTAVMGARPLSIGPFPIDCGFFPSLSVPQRVWRPKDFTSDYTTHLFSSPSAMQAVAETERVYPFMKVGPLLLQISLRLQCHLALSNKGRDKTSTAAVKQNVRARWLSGVLLEAVTGWAAGTWRNQRSAWIGSTMVYAQTSTPDRENNSPIEHHHGGIRQLSQSRECSAAAYVDLCKKRGVKEELRTKLEKGKIDREMAQGGEQTDSMEAGPMIVDGGEGYQSIQLQNAGAGSRLPEFLSPAEVCFVISEGWTQGVSKVLEKLGIPVPPLAQRKYLNFKELGEAFQAATNPSRVSPPGAQQQAAGGTSAGPLVGQGTSSGETSVTLGEDEDGVFNDEKDLGEEGVLAEMERAEKDGRPIPLEQKGEEEKGKEGESEQRDEDLEQVVSVLVQEDILLDREGREVSQVGDAAQTAISTEAGALHKFCDAFEAIRHAESQDDAVKQLLCFASGGAAVLDEKYAGGTGTEPGQSRFNRWVLPAEKLKDGSAAPGPSNPVGLIPIHLPTEFERGSVIRITAEGLEKRPKWLRSKELGGAWIVLSVYGRGLSGESTYKQAKLMMRKEKVDGNANHPAVSLHLFPVEMEPSEDPNVAGNAILDFTQTKREVIRYDVAKDEICQVFSQFAWSNF